MNTNLLGTIKSIEDKRDWVLEKLVSISPLPSSIDYKKDLMPVRDQSPLGTCAAMTASCMKEWQEKKNLNIFDYFSPMFIYNLRENKSESGMQPRNVMKILQDKGCCLENDFKYGNKNDPSEKVLSLAQKYKIKNYAQVTTIDGLKHSLISNGPCFLAIPVYNYNLRMWKPENDNQQLLGGHAITIVSYDDNKEIYGNKGAFLLRNSWGESWGEKGYCWFPYCDWDLKWEIWTTLDNDSGKPNPFQWIIDSWSKIKRFISNIPIINILGIIVFSIIIVFTILTVIRYK